jgi:regulatory protein
VRPSKPDSASGELDAEACTRAALDLLARREHSRRELTRKLGARGFSDDMIASALDGLERSGALAEARFTESFVRTRVAKGQGPARIRAELKQRGVADADADGALREAEVDWLATIRAVRLKRFGPEPPRDYRERARQARFLEYRGFDGEQIRTALDGDVEE